MPCVISFGLCVEGFKSGCTSTDLMHQLCFLRGDLLRPQALVSSEGLFCFPMKSYTGLIRGVVLA